jgi:hypothetical protein
MTHRSRMHRLAVVALTLATALSMACATDDTIAVDIRAEDGTAEETAPLGGDALSERRNEMQRAYRDLIHFHTTLESLRHRRDRNGSILFDQFLDAYMGTHLEPMLEGEWQARHPELMALDASLRFVQAEVLVRMRDTRRVQRTIEEIEERYRGRENMVVQYPIGGQGTIAEGLEILRSRKWRG